MSFNRTLSTLISYWALLGGAPLLVTALALSMVMMLIYGTLEMRSDNTETAVLGWPVWTFMPTAVVSCVMWALAALLEVIGTAGASDGT